MEQPIYPETMNLEKNKIPYSQVAINFDSNDDNKHNLWWESEPKNYNKNVWNKFM